MGFNIVWVGIENTSKSDLASLLSARDTELIDETNDAPVSAAELPNGWSIAFFNDVSLVTEDRIKALSEGRSVVTCAIFEGPMVSQAMSVENGEPSWSIAHVAQDGLFDLKVGGFPPEAFQTIKAQQTAKQKAEREHDDWKVDHIFDIPIEMAQHLTGYRHDIFEFDWGQPKFTVFELT